MYGLEGGGGRYWIRPCLRVPFLLSLTMNLFFCVLLIVVSVYSRFRNMIDWIGKEENKLKNGLRGSIAVRICIHK